MKPFPSWPVRAQLMLLVFIAALPALLVILFSGIERERLEQRSLEANAQEAVQEIAHTYYTTVAETRRLLSVLANLPQVRNQDPGPCSELLARLLRDNPQFLTLQVSRDGRIFASGTPFADAVFVGDRKYYRDAAARRQFAVGEYIIGRTVPGPQINFAYPILDSESNLLGVVQSGYSLKYFGQLLDKIEVPWPGAMAVVMDHAGTCLNLFPDDPKRVGQPEDPVLVGQMTNNYGSFRMGAGGNSRFVVYQQLRLDRADAHSAYLTVRLAIPEGPMLARVHALLIRNLLLLAMTAALVMLAAWHLGNATIVKPVNKLVAAMRRIGAGDLSPRISPVNGGQELEHLARGFDAMAEMVLTRDREREKDQQALMRGEQRYRLLFNNTADGLFVYELGQDLKPGPFVEVNDAACLRLGYSREELARMRPGDVCAGATLLDDGNLEQCLKTGFVTWESQLLTKDGRFIPCEITSRFFEMDGRKMILSTGRDLSDRKAAEEEKHRLEEQLRHAQKMDAVGRLAGGVAHDFNNMLTAILGNAELLLSSDNLSAEARGGFEEIQRVGVRAAGLTRQLLTFSRKQIVTPVIVNLNEKAAEARQMLSRLIGEQIELVLHTEPALWSIRADSLQIDQVLINLAVNARDAMPSGGRLVIETSNRIVGPDEPPPFPGCAPGQWVALSVSDNGCGMNPETRQRLFEPFFTTKPSGKGVGLGLATVYGIVKHCGGGISVISEPDLGAKFTLFFPRALESGGAASPESSTDARASAVGVESILLAEDDSSVREMVRRALQKHGYAVAAVPDGFAALTLFDPARFDVLLTDIVMPGMNGYELHRALCTLKPGLKVLYMSGHIDDSVIRSELSSGKAPFLQKPFKTEALLTTLRKVIDGVEP